MCTNADTFETNKKIEQYKKDNRDQIAQARSHINPEVLKLEAIIEEERLMAEHRQLETITLEKEEKLRKLKTKEALIDDLMFSETDAESIVASHKLSKEQYERDQELEEELARKRLEIIAESTARLNMLRERPQFSSGITAGASGAFLPIPKKTEEPLFKYEEPEVLNKGPPTPSILELLEIATARNDRRQAPFGNLVKEPTVPEKAGGYHQVLEVRRSLLDCCAQLSFNPKIDAGVKNLASEKIPINQQSEQSVMEDVGDF